MRLFWRYFTIHLRSTMQHKASFWMTIFGQFLGAFSSFLTVYFLFDRFHQVEGFTFPEVLLCFGTVLLAFSLAECFVRGFDTFPQMIGNGEFDRILVRPRGLVFQILASKIEFTRLGRFLQAVLVFCYAIPASGVDWTLPRVAVLFLMIAGGTVLFSGLFVVYASLSFFTLEGLEFLNIFTDGGREFGAYPLSVYGRTMLKFYTFVVPLALVQYYPLLFVLGRSGSLWYALAPLMSLAFLIPYYALWRFGVRHYRSTGS